MPAEIDFSSGERGKFFRPGMRVCSPVYLDSGLQEQLEGIARSKGIELSGLVNELLRKDIELMDVLR